MSNPTSHAVQYRTTGILALLVLASFLLQVLVFTTEYRPDEWRAIHVFLDRIAGGDVFADELWVRVTLTLFNVAFVLSLRAARLIEDRTLVFALIWPLTLFLFSKIYWEFFVFPLCLVRCDLRPRAELAFVVFLLALLGLTGESNVAVVLIWRLVLLAQSIGFRKTAPIGVIGFGIALDVMMSSGLAGSLPFIGPQVARFSWTRDIVNPEYSVIETVAVFLSSFHFFSLHNGAYWIDAVFSLIVLGVIFISRDAWRQLHTHLWTVVAFVSVVFFFTAVTHAFQNARYYFFFLPVLAAITPRDKYVPLAVLGVLHVIVRGFSL